MCCHSIKGDAMRRVLVIDDQRFIRDTVAAALGSNGFEVVGFASGSAGIAEFEKSTFDLVIVDIYMPGMDGVKVIRELRARNPRIPILAMSGVELGESARTALDFLPNAGLSSVVGLKKPFRAADILDTVEKLMEREQTLQGLPA
jgi:CheY-like chemotaxis protein